MALGVWYQVEAGDPLIYLCSEFLQTSNPEYQGLTYKNLNNLLNQFNHDDPEEFMCEMYLHQDDADSNYDLVLLMSLSLNRDAATGEESWHDWCITVGISGATPKTAQQILDLVKSMVKDQIDDGRSIVVVWRTTDVFNSGSKFDNAYQLLMAEVKAGTIQAGPKQQVPAFANYRSDFGAANLYRLPVTAIN